MPIYIDLHVHTTASDGSMTPAEIVRYAYEKGLAAVAITDHDTMDGVEQALEEGRKLGFEVIAGVEISVDFMPEMHLLGYFLDGHYEPILNTLQDLREKREYRNPRIVSKLNDLGIEISMSEVDKKAGGSIISRAHIARVLVEKGYVADMEEAFDKYLAFGRKAYVKKEKLAPDEGIAAIIRSGGIPVLAHPIYLDMTMAQLDNLLGELAEAGLKGIEAYYTDNTASQTEELLQLAKRHSLVATGGSDFHGSFKPEIELGSGRGLLRVPYSVLEQLRNV
ncbi:MAG: PHP domain-containing protein [Acetivibrionales bacterium]